MEWITPYLYRTMSILPPFHIVQSYDNMDVLKNITLTYYINSGGSLVAKLCPTLATPWTVAHQLLCPWDFPGKNTGVGCCFLLHGIFLTEWSNLCLLHWQVDSLPAESISPE